jgi:hypothetical protein
MRCFPTPNDATEVLGADTARWRMASAARQDLVGNHTSGRPASRRITTYLRNGGTLENAAAMANHASTRTTQLYDRRRDEVSLDEVERIAI